MTPNRAVISFSTGFAARLSIAYGPLMRTLDAIRNAGARVEEIVLTSLGLDDIGRLVTDAVLCEPERARPLAQLVHEKTSGNPFFAARRAPTRSCMIGFSRRPIV